MNMAEGSNWFDALTEKIKDNPLYIAEGLALDIAIQMNEALEKLGLSRKELAKRLLVSQPYISEILNGTPNLTLLTLSKLAVALDLQVRVSFAPGNFSAKATRFLYTEDYDPFSPLYLSTEPVKSSPLSESDPCLPCNPTNTSISEQNPNFFIAA
jgi:transcriptional regulator with XRE-family HTH domain